MSERTNLKIWVAIVVCLAGVRVARANSLEQCKLMASDGSSSDYFGRSVAIDGDYAIVGAYGEDDNGGASGSAYIFQRSGSGWVEQCKLTASDGSASDYFGWSVAISGDYAIVGAFGNDDYGSSSGSAYIFQRTGSGWVEQTKLTASDDNYDDRFGYSVAISGDYAIVGAYKDDDKGSDSGSAYIFQRSGSGWVEQCKLTASDGYTNDFFGSSVAISGDYAIVGAYGDDDNGSYSGSAYLFQCSGSGWVEQCKLTASDGYTSDRFGQSVAISGDYAIVGAHKDDDNGSSSGSAYIFQRSGSGCGWEGQCKLTASDGYTSDFFGWSVAISGDYAIVGAYGDDDNGSDSGSAYLFQRSGSGWEEQTKQTAADGNSDDRFGYSVAISGRVSIVGAYSDDDNGGDSGSAYVFAAPVTYYVDWDAVGANDGSSWEDAFNYLQDALAAVYSGDEIWVAQGIYKPDRGGGNAPGNRTATFQLINGVAIRGGYAGCGEPDPNARDIEVYETVLSGDLLGNDGPDFANNGENSYHVVTSSYTDANAIIDGFTIKAGNANGPQHPHNSGGGMYNASSNSTVMRCIFVHNSAVWRGGAMLNSHSHLSVIDCEFNSNVSDFGAAMRNSYGGSTFINCEFNSNSAGTTGGAMYNGVDNSDTLNNITFSGNLANHAGVIYITGNSSPSLRNCVFRSNSVNYRGGALYVRDNSSPILENCTFSGNSAEIEGGSIYNTQDSNVALTNCILWGDTPEEIYVFSGTVRITYSDVQGGWPGLGNIDADPWFADPCNGDYHLLVGSPCIDAGDPDYIPEPDETDIDGQPRVWDGRVDMGADEFVPMIEAAMKFTPQALNPGSEGNWVKAHLVLPEGFNAEDVDANTPAILQPGDVESEVPMNVFVNEANFVEVEAAFERGSFCEAGISDEAMEVRVVGSFTSGQYFYGTDTIKIINKSFKYLGVLASHWLEGGCGAPDWCGGVDLDHNSMVDLVDFAMFDGCCIEVVRQ